MIIVRNRMAGKLKDVPPITYWGDSCDIAYDTVKKFFKPFWKGKLIYSESWRKLSSICFISRMLRNLHYFLRFTRFPLTQIIPTVIKACNKVPSALKQLCWIPVQIRELSMLIAYSDHLLSNSCYLCTQMNQVHVDLGQTLTNALWMYNRLSSSFKRSRNSVWYTKHSKCKNWGTV